MSSELISERFQRLPAIQHQREQEYQQQAREASSLVHRLDQTRQEAERVAIAEIETTKRMMEKELRNHPDWLAWRRQYDEIAGKARQWDLGRGAAVARLQQDLDRVRREVDAKGREYDTLLSLMERSKIDRATVEGDNITNQDSLRRLQEELNGLLQQEAEMSRQFGQQNSLIVELNQKLTEIRQDITRKERDNAVKQQQQQALMDQLRGHERELDHFDTQIGTFVTKKTESEQLVNHLQALESQLTNQLNSQQQSFDTLFDDAQQQLREAMETQRIAVEERDRIKQEHLLMTGNMSMLSGDVHTLHNRQQAITEEINRLLEERRTIESALADKQHQLSTLQERVSNWQDQQYEFEDRIRKAHEVVERAQSLVDNYLQTKRQQEQERQQLLAELERVKSEHGKADQLLTSIENDLRTAHSSRRGLLERMDSLNAQLSQLQMDSFEDLNIRLMSIQQELDNHTPIVNQYRDQLRNVQSAIAKTRSDIANIQQRIADNEKKLRALPMFDDRQLVAVNERLRELSDTVNDINRQIQEYQTGNPYKSQLQQVQSQEATLRSQCWEAVKRSPSAAIQDQLKREAEAVMRAEAAVACCRKQQQVETEARNLAAFHLEQTPRVVLDDRAKDVMLSECTGRRPKHEIAGIVLDMCEQRHIQIAH